VDNYLVIGKHSWNRESFNLSPIAKMPNWHYVDDVECLNYEFISQIEPRMIFVLHWSNLISPNLISQFQFVIFHMTDLPFGRGGSPLQNLIIRGFNKTVVSAIRASNQLDAGPIFMKRELSLSGSAQEIYKRASKLSIDMAIEISANNLEPIPQVGTVTNFLRRLPAESEVNDATTIPQLYDFIRMLDAEGYPRAFFVKLGFRFEFSEASLIDGSIEARVKIETNPEN